MLPFYSGVDHSILAEVMLCATVWWCFHLMIRLVIVLRSIYATYRLFGCQPAHKVSIKGWQSKQITKKKPLNVFRNFFTPTKCESNNSIFPLVTFKAQNFTFYLQSTHKTVFSRGVCLTIMETEKIEWFRRF